MFVIHRQFYTRWLYAYCLPFFEHIFINSLVETLSKCGHSITRTSESSQGRKIVSLFGTSDDIKITRRGSSWTQDFAMLYIDNPVGTGFRYVILAVSKNKRWCCPSLISSLLLLKIFFVTFPYLLTLYPLSPSFLKYVNRINIYK